MVVLIVGADVMAEANLVSIVALRERRLVNWTLLNLKWLKVPWVVCMAHNASMLFKQPSIQHI